MANEKRLINVNPAYIQHILAKVPYYADEIWKFTAMTERFPTVDAVEVVHARWDEWWPGDCALIMTGEEMLYQCSACTAKYSNVEGFKYCPHCGAFIENKENRDNLSRNKI